MRCGRPRQCPADRAVLCIRLAVRTTGLYFGRWVVTPQEPIKRAYEQSPAPMKKRLEEDDPSIAARTGTERAEVHHGDEGGLRSILDCGKHGARPGRVGHLRRPSPLPAGSLDPRAGRPADRCPYQIAMNPDIMLARLSDPW